MYSEQRPYKDGKNSGSYTVFKVCDPGKRKCVTPEEKKASTAVAPEQKQICECQDKCFDPKKLMDCVDNSALSTACAKIPDAPLGYWCGTEAKFKTYAGFNGDCAKIGLCLQKCNPSKISVSCPNAKSSLKTPCP